MAIKLILAPLSDMESRSDKAILETAIFAARRVNGCVRAVYAPPGAAAFDQVQAQGLMMSEVVLESVTEANRNFHEEQNAQARVVFEKTCQRMGASIVETQDELDAPSAIWLADPMFGGDILKRHGRFADLFVVSRPEEGEPESRMFDAALFGDRRPTLVAPPTPARQLGSRIAIGWNGSDEAIRAVRAAMPLLATADEVFVLHSAEDQKYPDKGCAELMDYLALHEIEAQDVLFPATDRRWTGKALLTESENRGVDLLVMGGYGHSRMGELILGGVTRHVLTSAKIPALMVH